MNELLFYREYEEFYKMTSDSEAFNMFCRDAFGADFSQDGFSDIRQIDRMLEFIPKKNDLHILDIGCGNGKMLGYLQSRTGAHITGFDYSENAISEATTRFTDNSRFIAGAMGEVDFPSESFDFISSMDSIYFAKNISTFTDQVLGWLKPDGIFFVGYQEGDVMQKTENADTAVLSVILRSKSCTYDIIDITAETYELLKRKRAAAIRHKAAFEKEGNQKWFDMLMLQTDCAAKPFEEFAQEMARYIFVIRKPFQHISPQ